MRDGAAEGPRCGDDELASSSTQKLSRNWVIHENQSGGGCVRCCTCLSLLCECLVVPLKVKFLISFFRLMPSTSQYASVLLLSIAMCAFQIQLLGTAIQHQHTKGGPQRVVEGSAESCSTSPTFMDATTSRRSDSE